jgi:hypothetical protein
MPLAGQLPPPTSEEAERLRQSRQVLGLITGHWAAQTVRAGAQLRVADHVAAGRRTAGEVAALESADADATFRLMRALASLGLLSRPDGATFELTPLGELLREDAPGSLRAAALARSGPGLWRCLELLPDAVRAGETQVTRALGGDAFEYFAAQPDEGRVFAQAMSALTSQVAQDAARLLDFGGRACEVADVGGANGALVIALMRAHPSITGLVFDQPHVVPGAQAAAAAAGLGDRFRAVGGDFFGAVPAADYYLLKWILHDWPDRECVRILRNCREAGGPGAGLLVVEALISDAGEPDQVALFDMNMLAATNGRQRSLDELRPLFDASGWRLTAVARTRTDDSLLELEAA